MKKEAKKRNPIITVIWILVILFLVSYVSASMIKIFIGDASSVSNGNVALIPISGVILSEDYGTFPPSGGVASSLTIVEMLKKAEANPNIDAVVLQINSPGGSPVATDEIASEIKLLKKPVVAMIREMGASGGYWIASSTEHIVANRMSFTGSIGVIGSYVGFEGLMNDYNITYNRLVAGKYKDMGTPYKGLTGEERMLYQGILDKLHDFFIDEVTANRNLPRENVVALAEGQVFLGVDALKLGLVDELGGQREVTAYLLKTYNITAEYVTYKQTKSLLDILSSIQSEGFFQMGRGIANEMMSPRASAKAANIII